MTLALLDTIRQDIRHQRALLTPLISPDDQTHLQQHWDRLHQFATQQQRTPPVLQKQARQQHLAAVMREQQALAPLIQKYTPACQQLTAPLAKQQPRWVSRMQAIHRHFSSPEHHCNPTEILPSVKLIDQLLEPAVFLTSRPNL
ncbi:hypothetical protein [Hymenobacter sp. UYP22]|uniref:hypothetical protein n=1 Tax=Hymenobacter sp. UYP22 TaxID=3156348 RepID=UPI0033931950